MECFMSIKTSLKSVNANLERCGYTVVEFTKMGVACFAWTQDGRYGKVCPTEDDAWDDAAEDERITANEYVNY
jgi:hypothetical protein